MTDLIWNESGLLLSVFMFLNGSLVAASCIFVLYDGFIMVLVRMRGKQCNVVCATSEV